MGVEVISYKDESDSSRLEKLNSLDRVKFSRSETVGENKKAAEDGGSVQYSKGKSSCDYSKSFSEQIDDYKKGKFPERDTFILGGTSEFYQKLGFNALPMTINKTHVDYALYNTKDANHFLGESLLKQLPEKINHPVAVFVSQTHPTTSVVALIKMIVNGNNVITPIYIDGFGFQNGIKIDSNAVKSVHGRDNAITKLLYDAIIDESNGNVSLFYINKKEALTLLHHAGLQLPGKLIPDGGFIHSIREKGSPVKPKYENVTETQQFKRWFGDWQNHPQNASKIVNADGTPKIMYHGTKAENGEFWEFDYSKAKRKGGLGLRAMGKGNYFTSIKLDTNGKYDRVIPAYLDIKKPFEYQGGRSLSEQISEKLGIETTEMDYDTLQQVLRNAGYDGVVQYDKNGEISIAVTFDSEQIKSATDNIGTFDRGQKDIRYSKGDAYDPFEPYTPPAYATMPEYSAPLQGRYEYQGEGYTAANGLKLFSKYSVDTARDYIMSELMLS